MNAVAALQTTPLLNYAPTPLVERFAEHAARRSYAKGKLLFVHEDPAEYFYVIESGWVKLFRETLDGNEAIVDVINDGHMFGESAVFDDNCYTFSAEVVEDAVLWSIPLSVMANELETSADFARSMLSMMSRFRKQQTRELEHRDLQNAPQRIGCFLLRLCKPDATGRVTLQLPYDKTLLAARLGMKPETFSRALSRLRDESNIRIKVALVEIDNLQQLSSYCCNMCSSNYPCQDLSTI